MDEPDLTYEPIDDEGNPAGEMPHDEAFRSEEPIQSPQPTPEAGDAEADWEQWARQFAQSEEPEPLPKVDNELDRPALEEPAQLAQAETAGVAGEAQALEAASLRPEGRHGQTVLEDELLEGSETAPDTAEYFPANLEAYPGVEADGFSKLPAGEGEGAPVYFSEEAPEAPEPEVNTGGWLPETQPEQPQAVPEPAAPELPSEAAMPDDLAAYTAVTETTPQMQEPVELPPHPVDEATLGYFSLQEAAEEPTTPQPELMEAASASPAKKTALILSGGGARGAFQVGAEKYAREVKGYHWDIIAGVSVGALNGAMLAMHKYRRLMEIWDSITNGQVFNGGFNLFSVIRLLFGGRAFYDNQPLQRLMAGEFESGRVVEDLRVGAVSLQSGAYEVFTREFLELPKAILASSSIPVVFPPVDISEQHAAMVDGGVRNISPVGDVLALEPDEIVIINCNNAQPPRLAEAPNNVVSIGMRTLDIMQNEIFINDMQEFLRINALVKEAEAQGVVLHHPRTGRALKYYPCVVIEPQGELGGVLDFSQPSVQASLREGVRRARQVLGRP